MTAPTITNDVEAVQEYSATLTADADAWREIATSATAISEQLRNDAADWVAVWEPEDGYGVAVSQMCARMDALVTAANATASEIEKRAATAVAESLNMADTDDANGQTLDNVNAEVVAI
ncbi:Uncharacterised protein [Mycobacteroides abscessus subsp. abscessus]|uniref:hypothetical protein n=1 Tax=Mycobacteroides abscessus TaxID=36809 RepID=UPI0009262D1D|nr:hypothetical protein [Mycobacteroides abscessus]MDM2173430.1 hypothetical protein [Mycobacteroides abscessus]MDM2176299.1 hypothetical protein [Mycobacteroides abscessus]MDM2204864.1 hypothetical protein [Mycobacteroides abscessus]MDM2213852.1 hypothetical protein [Mycobacteroides abscessus]MDM2215783.1 hypothetical protein [Mycobacteroides abscessus]